MGDAYRGVQQGRGRPGDLGFMQPMGGGSRAREFLHLKKGHDALTDAINSLSKSNFNRQEASLLSIILSIGGDDTGTHKFAQFMEASSLAEGGRARREGLMSDAGMLVPSWMEDYMYSRNEGDGNGNGRFPQKKKGMKAKDESE